MEELKLQGKTLEIMRKKAHMTQADGARIFKHGRAWINEIEKGRMNISFKDAKKLVEHYGFSLNDYDILYNEVESKARDNQ